MPITSLDAFQQIIDCQFGGDWFFVSGPNPGAFTALSNYEIDFPTTEGGTPGFIPVISVGFGLPQVFAPYVKPASPPGGPVKLTSAMLGSTLPSNAGASFTTFALRGLSNTVDMFFKLDGRFLNQPNFRIRVTASGPTPGGAECAVGMIQKNIFKAGYMLVGTQSGQIPVRSRKDTVIPLGAPYSASFVVDPNTGQVS